MGAPTPALRPGPFPKVLSDSARWEGAWQERSVGRWHARPARWYGPAMDRFRRFKRNVGAFRAAQHVLVYGLMTIATGVYAALRATPWPILIFAAASLLPFLARARLVDQLKPTLAVLTLVGPLIMAAGIIHLLARERLPVDPVVWTHGLLFAIPAYLSAMFFTLSDPQVLMRRR